MGFRPCNIASRELTDKFRQIDPSVVHGVVQRPCALTLRDGTCADRVLCVEEPHGLYNKSWIPLDNIVEVADSPFRLPAALANVLYEAGESGMGYVIYTIVLRDGSSIAVGSGYIVDFPDLPDGVTSEDIVDVLPNEGRERIARGDCIRDADFLECYYVPFDLYDRG